MAETPPQPATTGTPEPEGVVSGAILRLIRTQLGLSQERFAELLERDPNTIKAWENGRRPLGKVRTQDLRGIMRRLIQSGAPAGLVAQLTTAIDVDHAIVDILEGDSVEHPMGSWVHTRAWHDLLRWPITGIPPSGLREANGRIPRPRLAVPDRALLLDHLRTAADRVAHDDKATLLRRQVYFVASWDDTPQGRDWLARMEAQELRRLRHHNGWTPSWVAGRSLAVARAAQGDPEQLRHFIARQIADDRTEAANLTYWAYWIGEYTEPAVSDDFMATGDLGTWRGTGLLRHLTAGLDAAVPYVDLTVHSIHALIERRPYLLDDDPALTAELRSRCAVLLDHRHVLSDQACRELDLIHYAAKLRSPR